MRKVAYFCEELSSYRVSIINRLAEKNPVTVFCNRVKESDLDIASFEVQKIGLRKIGPFYRYTGQNLYKLCCNYDVVIGLANLRFYQMMLYCLIPKPFKLALWGIGVTGSYTKKFGSWSIATILRVLVTRFADGLIFYSDRPISLHRRLGYKRSRMFIAHNTVDNLVDMNVESQRDSFLFVGTLYKAKGLEELIDSYERAMINKGGKLPKLTIIGGGELLEPLREYVSAKRIDESIILTGPIYDKQALQSFFDKAIFCVSPTQAGLSVLTSMSFGVPFVTCSGAFTGGEILNIKHDFNGLLLEEVSQLSKIFEDASENPLRFFEMGKNAFEYYREERHPDIMADALVRCVQEI